MATLFDRMMNTFCAISKLEYLLEVVRLTYENIKDSRQPKKTMNDLGADGGLISGRGKRELMVGLTSGSGREEGSGSRWRTGGNHTVAFLVCAESAYWKSTQLLVTWNAGCVQYRR